MVCNYHLLTEAAKDEERTEYRNLLISECKKKMNTCRLAKFKSADCDDFFSVFFCNRVPEDTEVSFDDWIFIYEHLLTDTKFHDNLCFFLTLYQPKKTSRLFGAFADQLYELKTLQRTGDIDHLISKYGTTLAALTTIQRLFDGVINIIRSQVNQVEIHSRCRIISTTLDGYVQTCQTDMQKFVMDQQEKHPGSVAVIVPHKLSEEAIAFIQVFESCITDEVKNEYASLDESVISGAKDAAIRAGVKLKKFEEAIDQKVMKSWKELRASQRNRKHAEIVGEASRISHEVKRLLVAAPAYAINPLIGVIIWLGSLAFDRHTDKKDRKVLVDDIKDELEILEKKIEFAERNDDKKEQIQLIRERQKLVRELERIERVRYQKRGG